LAGIELPGCKNLRDLGGHTTRTGSRIACGRLFRGAAPSAGANLFGGLGIRRIIDLRATSELASERQEAASGLERLHVPLLEALAKWSDPFDRTPRSTAFRYLEMLEDGQQPLLRVLDLLGTADEQPTLIHCVAGRDRTGMVIGCVLDLLEVPDESIARDYALSSVMDDAEGRSANPENLLWLLRLIREKYASVLEMVRMMGASEASLVGLSTALVEQRPRDFATRHFPR
jgi:protein-tyrosine phosphatase